MCGINFGFIYSEFEIPKSEINRIFMRLTKVHLIAALLILTSKNVNAQNSIEITPLSGIKIFSPGNISLDGKSYGAEVAYNIYQKENPAEWVKN